MFGWIISEVLQDIGEFLTEMKMQLMENGFPVPEKIISCNKNALGEIPIIAEDLGLITPDVIELRDAFNLPGMKVLQFAFDSGEANDYLPHNYDKNCVVYTGTHDNETVNGWFENAIDADKNMFWII